jgi:peptide/nickel transport system substrate-binding protein
MALEALRPVPALFPGGSMNSKTQARYLLVAAACGSKKSDNAGGKTAASAGSTDVTQASSGAPKVGGTLTYALAAESDGWDPTKNRWSNEGTTVGLAVFDPLAAYDANTIAQPYLAQSFTPNADFTQWTIALRPNVAFSDGTTLNASVLKTIFGTHKASALTSPAVSDLDSVTVTGELTAVFKMKEPWASFPSSLTGQLGMVPSPGQLASPDGSRNPVGTGPFKMTSWVPDGTFSTVKNPTYWRKDESGTQLPYLDGVTFKVISEPDSAVDAVLSGQVNMAATSIPSAVIKIDTATAAGQLQRVEVQGQTDSAFAMMNEASPPFDNLTARQAMAAATDSVAYRAAVDRGVTLPNHQVFKEGTPYYTDSPFQSYDLDQAKKLVQQYQRDTGQPLDFTLLVDSTAAGALQAQFLKSQWEAAGMKVTIQQEEQSKLITDAVLGNYQVTGWGQFGSPDPDYDYVWWIGDNAKPAGSLALNIARNKDPIIDAALRAARATTDQTVRKQQYATFSDQLNKDIPYIWLARGRYLLYADNTVRGMTQGPLPDGSPSYPIGGPGGFALAVRLTQTWLDK